MAGKTLIDIELRNELVQFVDNCRLPGYTYDLSVPSDLYFRLKPKRIVNKKSVVGEIA